jgi:hypothetical protein
MFHHWTRYRQLISLALPFILLWSWMACVMVCSDIGEHNTETEVYGETNNDNESECADSANLDDCTLTATPAIFQERQTIPAHALTSKEIAFTPIKNPAFVSLSLLQSNINRHSPPKTTTLLFLQLCNFRI